MLKELHAAITNFRWGLNTYWKAFVNRPASSELYDLDTAKRELRYHQDVLAQVLDLRAQARAIEALLDTQPLKGLHEKED